MITEEDTTKLFNVVTEVGVATAIDLLEGMRGNAEHGGKFLAGYDYAIEILQKSNELMKEQEGE